MDSTRTRVKVAVAVEKKDTPNWPTINYDYEKKINTVMRDVRNYAPDIDFDVKMYEDVEEAKSDYENDRKTYDGVLVLLMTCWKWLELFYSEKAAEGGLPCAVASVPFCGDSSLLMSLSPEIRAKKLPVPIITSLDNRDIANAARLFDVLAKMKKTKILVIADKFKLAAEKAITETFGCEFINKTAADLEPYFNSVDDKKAKAVAKRWVDEAAGVVEPSESDILESARLYVAVDNMKKDLSANAVTIDCLTLSYNNGYCNHKHMYPCLSHYEMNCKGEVAVCEADVNATAASLVIRYLTKRPGYVSDPVIDTSTDRIIYCHCVACTKIYSEDDPRTCPYYIRSHAEDKLGASVQVIFPEGEKLTTTMFDFPNKVAVIHSSTSCGNVGGEEGCRSKMAASCNAKNIADNWVGSWHRVTVFGDYRRDLLNLYKLKGIDCVEEDK